MTDPHARIPRTDAEAFDQEIARLQAEVAQRDAALAHAAETLDAIFRLANGLSISLKGTPEMYEANKIMHAVWAIQAALTPHAEPPKK